MIKIEGNKGWEVQTKQPKTFKITVNNYEERKILSSLLVDSGYKVWIEREDEGNWALIKINLCFEEVEK